MAQRIRREVVVIDASALYAIVDRREGRHAAAVKALEGLANTRIAISPMTLAEVDYLVGTRLGTQAEIEMLRDVEAGAYRLYDFGADDLRDCIQLLERYGDADIGLADASTVVLADRLRTRRLFTFDHRHFGVIRPLSGGRFDLIPE